MDSLYDLTNDYLTLMEYADSTDPDDELTAPESIFF